MNHTPGPWTCDDTIIHDVCDELSIFIYGPDGPGYGRVAMAFAECGREDELEANARLIASAPELDKENKKLHMQNIELVKALEYASAALRNTDYPDGVRLVQALMFMDDAIAKANACAT